MCVRVYLLLDIVNGNQAHATELLKDKPGVKLVDSLENSPDLVVVVEAPSMEQLGEAIMPVIECIDGVAENLKMLIGQDTKPENECHPRHFAGAAIISGKRSGTAVKPGSGARSRREMAHA